MDKTQRSQITRDDILDAVRFLDDGEEHPFGPSIYYDLLLNEKRYPPKAVIGLAARRILGRILRPDEFSGGQDSWAFEVLRERGFSVVGKETANRPEHPDVSPPKRIWMEETKTAEHNHGGKGWEFGTCLWSPSVNKAGAKSYALMAEPRPGDVVVHVDSRSARTAQLMP